MAVGLWRRDPRFLFLSDAARAPGLAGAEPERYGWRLLAANNRPMGRGVGVSASLAGCRAAAAQVQTRIAAVTTLIGADAQRGTWRWTAALDGVRVAVSVHAYARRIECARALDQFLASAGRADADLGVVRYFGPRALRDFDGDGSEAAEPTGAVS